MISLKIFRTLNISTVEIEALQFRLKFAAGVNNLSIVNLINFNYRYNDSNFNKAPYKDYLL